MVSEGLQGETAAGADGSRWSNVAGAIRRARSDARASRARRVVLMVLFIWIVSAFDLTFTMLAHKLGGFKELNPMARHLLDKSEVLITYKVTMVFAASLIFLAFRRRRFTEIGCWGMAVVHTILAFLWAGYYTVAG